MIKSSGTAIVTGGAKRIGREICFKLSDLGFKIALHYHHSYREAQETAQLIQKKGGICKLFPANLQNEKQVASLIYKVNKTFPDLNVLVNSASIFEESHLKTVTLKDFNRDFNVHVKTPLFLSQHLANVCPKGQIINILDTNIAKNKTAHFTYLLSKKTLTEFTKMAAVELAPNIRVNAIAPGFILIPDGKTKSYAAQKLVRIPLKTKGNPEQITQCLEFLINNSYITGQIIFCDGGEHLI